MSNRVVGATKSSTASCPGAASNGSRDVFEALGGHPPEVICEKAHLVPRLNTLLASGGDERIWPDPKTGRNKYGTPIAPASDEIWFSSSTASAISERGYGAAMTALAGILGDGPARTPLYDWQDGLRRRVRTMFGRPDSEVVLCPSGTDGELLALSLAKAIMPGPITNIVVAPDETGSGVLRAADGRHFNAISSSGASHTPGARLEGWERADIATAGLRIRDGEGVPLAHQDVDGAAVKLACEAVAAGRNVLLHVLDCSKTGLAGVTRASAKALKAAFPERVQVVVDACQLRCDPERLRQDLELGFMVLITGSKFAGGPPFCGALLLPADYVDLQTRSAAPPGGLVAYTSRLDWPEPFRMTFAGGLPPVANLGAGLRWEAALTELDRLADLAQYRQLEIVRKFSAEVRRRLPAISHARAREEGGLRNHLAHSIFPVTILDGHGRAGSKDVAQRVHEALRKGVSNIATGRSHTPPCHIGQPVALGRETVLRICLGAPQIGDVAERMANGMTLETAFAPLADQLDILFEAWAELPASIYG